MDCMRRLMLVFVAVFEVLSIVAPISIARAGTVLQFPKDDPAFTFELPDNMQAEYQADGRLVCTPKDGSFLKGVFQALPNVANDQRARSGLNQLIRLEGPRFLSGSVQYPAIFDEPTASGVPTINVSAFGMQGGKQAGLAFIVFSKSGKYYELTVSGAVDAMTSLSFPHAFRETMKLTP
jgi:hypothetical protein